MKTQKSPDSEEVTPSKKVLKQARLPFKIISDVSPKSVSPQTRKRKLSAPEPEPVTKVGKVTKENVLNEPLVVISDDDSKDAPQDKQSDKQLNPFVKLVDTAWKKKLQKSKAAKKRKSSKTSKKNISNGSIVNNESTSATENSDKGVESVEEMEVDEAEETHCVESNEEKATDKSEDLKDNKKDDDSNIILLEDSNSSETSSINKSTKSKKSDEKQDEEQEDKSEKKKENKNEDSNSSSKVGNESPEAANKGHTSEDDCDLKEHSKLEEAVTPKRSDRIKSKTDDKNSNTSLVSNCDESFNSSPSTPRRSARNVSITNSQGDVSMTEATNINLTPKQLQKKLESAKKKEEREKERLDREKKRQQEKEERAKQRQEKEDQKKREREEKEEARKKEKEEKEEQKRKEREEKEKQKELEKKLKEEKEEQKRKEREEKEEQKKKEKEAREEEKRKKQEALEQEKLEQEQKKKKAAEAFVSFFVPKQKGDKDQVTLGPVSKNNLLSSFTLKSDMRLAPTTRVCLADENRSILDDYLKEQNAPESSLYIKSLKSGSQKPLRDGKTWPLSDKDDDVMIVEDELPPADGAGEIISCDTTIREKLRPKLLAFHENRRPPYWGTWRKKSSSINPRQPFKTDEKFLDYEVDSDEEWEEVQDGESIDGSVANSDEEPENDEYEVDNEVFVPHGYLSDEEATMDGDDVLSLSPETQKAKLKNLEDEFESEMKKPMEKLKPRLYGLLWETPTGKPENCVDALWNYFQKLAMIMDDPTPLLQPATESEELEKKKVKKKKIPEGEEQSPKNEKKKRKVDDKDGKKPKVDNKKLPEKKNQPGINTFLTKLKTS